MKNIRDLYNTDLDFLVKDIKTNSKDVEECDLFVCIKGINTDRHNFIKEAIDKGCSGLIVERGKDYSVPYIKVDDTTSELGPLSKKFYEYQDTLKLIGVTGTDGKTTTSSIIRDMLEDCGYIGTNGVKSKKIDELTHNTTPDINIIYKYLSLFEKEGLKYAAMEVSSEGLLHNRTRDLEFDIGILTNVSEDHLNIHKTLTNYIDSKIKLFKKIKSNGYAILNHDDRFFDKFRENVKCNLFTYGANLDSDLKLIDYTLKKDKTIFKVKYLEKTYSIESPLLGLHNIYNLMAGISTLLCLGFSMNKIKKRISLIKIPDGRCEVFDIDNYTVILDYAHTTNGLKNILTFLNTLEHNRIITVTGCAGGREKEKRGEIGKVSQELSDLVIYTMDDPRYERVSNIIKDMIDNHKNNYEIVEDRKEAITKAFSIAKDNDIILIAGKGRDNYMAIEDRYEVYSDYEIIKDYINR